VGFHFILRHQSFAPPGFFEAAFHLVDHDETGDHVLEGSIVGQGLNGTPGTFLRANIRDRHGCLR